MDDPNPGLLEDGGWDSEQILFHDDEWLQRSSEEVGSEARATRSFDIETCPVRMEKETAD